MTGVAAGALIGLSGASVGPARPFGRGAGRANVVGRGAADCGPAVATTTFGVCVGTPPSLARCPPNEPVGSVIGGSVTIVVMGGTTFTSPTSMSCPPVVWWQWTAIVDRRPRGEQGRGRPGLMSNSRVADVPYPAAEVARTPLM